VTRVASAGKGAREFWRNHLRRLKFHNAALPITVDYTEADLTAPITLSLKFEHKDPEVLEKIGGNVAGLARTPQRRRAAQPVLMNEMTEDEKEALARQQSPNFREAPVDWKKQDDPLEADAQEAAEQAAIEAEATPTTPARPEATEKSPSDVDLSNLSSDAVVPSPNARAGSILYTRSVTLGLRNRSAGNIWTWFSDRTRCTPVPRSAEDIGELRKLGEFFKQSAIDRERVKEGRDAVRKEKEDLARARGEANKLKEEAV
jgi:Mitochondrial ribosomal protein L51 / S25 / CI-B8 domain